MRNNLVYQEARQQAGQLLQAVLDDRLDPDAALMAWPRVEDPSLNVGHQALMHFSVDVTGYHQTEPYYADVQLAWLQNLATQLTTGQALPFSSRAGYTRHTRFYWKPPKWWLGLQGWLKH
jgi:hypothetical protein